jgi:hypothetical protein
MTLIENSKDTSRTMATDPGFIYIMSSRSWQKGVYKVGLSIDPERRARELFTTGLPHPVELVKIARVESMLRAEQDIHNLLKSQGRHESKEFFRDLTAIESVFDQVTGVAKPPEKPMNSKARKLEQRRKEQSQLIVTLAEQSNQLYAQYGLGETLSEETIRGYASVNDPDGKYLRGITKRHTRISEKCHQLAAEQLRQMELAEALAEKIKGPPAEEPLKDGPVPCRIAEQTKTLIIIGILSSLLIVGAIAATLIR